MLAENCERTLWLSPKRNWQTKVEIEWRHGNSITVSEGLRIQKYQDPWTGGQGLRSFITNRITIEQDAKKRGIVDCSVRIAWELAAHK